MPLTAMLRCLALLTVLGIMLPPGMVLAEPIDPDTDQLPAAAAEEIEEGEPLDLSTPLADLGSGQPGQLTPSAIPHPGTGWGAKVGIEQRRPSFPAAELQPDGLMAGSVEQQSTGVAWASVTAPGLPAPLGWDSTAIETRLDPAQDQGKLAATLSRSVTVGNDFLVTMQNGYSVTLAPSPTSPVIASQGWATQQALQFNLPSSETTVSIGAALSSTDDKWLRSLSAEQKLFGGPVSLTGTVSETGTGDSSKSLKAGFKRTW